VVLAAALIVFSGTQAGEKKEKSVWKYVSAVVDGKEKPKKELEDLTLYIEGDNGTVKKGDKVVSKSTAKIDFGKKPIEIDVTITEGENKGKTYKGILELEDEGKTLRLCFADTGKDRPKEFSSKAGSGHVLEVMKKVEGK
jgi:uncharacterized protein (TIGR03067 family)